ncbi:MAG TPA: neutral zinc metallopeptidase, partial [Actinomycetota bacterium]|nr:neutral zinc metallopeptidase [Actinomycetota bacterium]
GDFAQAYVLAHEIGHHVQNLLGINQEVRQQQEADPDSANDLSIRLELQADCFAGVWAFTTYQRDLLESGDLDEGLAAAASVGDDRIQEQAGVDVDPETWTHGSAEQRVEWFRRGFEDGDPNDCDTFGGGLTSKAAGEPRFLELRGLSVGKRRPTHGFRWGRVLSLAA